MSSNPSARPARRRFIAISAAAAGLPLLPLFARVAGASPLRIWRGVALGADAILQIHHPDAAVADRLIETSLAEVARLERIFSLYDSGSAVSRLNRDGFLEGPPTDLVTLLGRAARFGAITDGAFDVTIQPLWRLYADHFSAPGADPAGPDHAAVERALALVDFRKLDIDPARIGFAQPGMAITLNGIAQGYVTDRVVALLRRNGVASAMVDMGEIRAIGGRPDARPWTVGLEDPVDPARLSATIELRDRAVATSGGYGLRFDRAGLFNHLLDPATGRSPERYLSVSVIASDATTADGLSTALSALPLEKAASILKACGADGRFVGPDGAIVAHRTSAG